MSEAKHKHLDFIQLAITRMGANSFLLKGWSVTLVAAVFALAHEDADQRYLFAAYLPNVIFYVLDSYYLHNERLFRKLYDAVAADDSSVPAFSMKLAPFDKGFPKKRAWGQGSTVLEPDFGVRRGVRRPRTPLPLRFFPSNAPLSG